MSNTLFIVLSILVLSSPGRAADRDPLLEADRILKESVIARAASLRSDSRAKEPADQTPAVAGYCVVYNTTGAEGMPEFLNFSCTDGVVIPFMRRWCWTQRCRDSFLKDAAGMLLSKGYESLASFHFGRRPDSSLGYHVFQRAGAVRGEKDRYCLALRWSGEGSSYQIDCADGAVTELNIAEPDNDTSAISRYMSERNYASVGRFPEDRRRFSPVVFRRSGR